MHWSLPRCRPCCGQESAREPLGEKSLVIGWGWVHSFSEQPGAVTDETQLSIKTTFCDIQAKENRLLRSVVNKKTLLTEKVCSFTTLSKPGWNGPGNRCWSHKETDVRSQWLRLRRHTPWSEPFLIEVELAKRLLNGQFSRSGMKMIKIDETWHMSHPFRFNTNGEATDLKYIFTQVLALLSIQTTNQSIEGCFGRGEAKSLCD